MNNFWTVFRSNYKSKLKTKSFIITTLLISVLIIGFINIDKIFNLFKEDEKSILIVTDEHQLFNTISQSYKKVDNSDHTHKFKEVKDEREAQKEVKNDKVEYALILKISKDGSLTSTYLTNKDVDEDELVTIQTILSQIKSVNTAQELKLSPKDFEKLTTPINVQTKVISSKLKDKDNEHKGSTTIVINAFMFLNYILILVYATQLATSVTTEKSSRVMELVVSSISPTKYLYAKLTSTLLIGLTQVAIWILIPVIAYKSGMISSEIKLFGEFNFGEINISLLLYGIVFFILGFLLYGSLACLFGSLMSRTEEASQAVMPLMILLLAALYIALFGISNPDSIFITITSYIPFFTPIVMLVRLGFLNVPTIEIVITILILTLITLATILATSRVYKGGVLLYGKGAFSNIKKALKLSKA
ncbi:ABC transporter permease [Priestia megaterium]